MWPRPQRPAQRNTNATTRCNVSATRLQMNRDAQRQRPAPSLSMGLRGLYVLKQGDNRCVCVSTAPRYQAYPNCDQQRTRREACLRLHGTQLRQFYRKIFIRRRIVILGRRETRHGCATGKVKNYQIAPKRLGSQSKRKRAQCRQLCGVSTSVCLCVEERHQLFRSSFLRSLLRAYGR